MLLPKSRFFALCNFHTNVMMILKYHSAFEWYPGDILGSLMHFSNFYLRLYTELQIYFSHLMIPVKFIRRMDKLNKLINHNSYKTKK